jgi:lipoate-protein ligase B
VAAGDHPPTLLLLEHPHTYTIGRSGRVDNLIWDEKRLTELGVQLHQVDRGGDITYHGPGQLVGYPILPLGAVNLDGRIPRADYVDYIRRLERVIVGTLAEVAIEGIQRKGLTGVWVSQTPADRVSTAPSFAKIASIGIKVDAAGVSQHGFSLNVDPTMSYWDGIIACGIPGAEMTSLSELLPSPPSMMQVADLVRRHFASTFAVEMTEVSLSP